MSLDHCTLRLLRYRAGHFRPLDAPLLACARYGSFAEVGLMILVGLRRGGAGRRALLRCLAAVGLLYLAIESIGRLAGRARPFAEQPDTGPLLAHSPGRSFPSRHVASAVAMAIIVHPTAPLAGRLMALIAVGLGLGRIRAGLHYPSDVLAGVALGALVGRRLSPARVQS